MKATCRTLIILATMLALSLTSAWADPESAAPELSREQQLSLVAARAKWGVIEVLLDEIDNPRFAGIDDGRASVGYRCRQVGAIAAPALARWVIRREKKGLGPEAERALDNIHHTLEAIDLDIGFYNTSDPAVYAKLAAARNAVIAKGRAEAKRIFSTLPDPRIQLPADLQRQVMRDELMIILALLANQDDGHRWTPAPRDGEPGPRRDEIVRVATLHSQVMQITAAMIEYVLANRTALPLDAQKTLVELHRSLTHDVEVSMRVIAKNDFDWKTMHDRFHTVFAQTSREINRVHMNW